MDTSLYAQRRARVAAAIGPNGLALIPTAPVQPRNRDSDYAYRHDSYFYYLTGFGEPQAWLVITGDGTSRLLCQPKDLERRNLGRLPPRGLRRHLPPWVDAGLLVAQRDAAAPVAGEPPDV